MANWIKNAIKSPGSLHRTLGVPQGTKIPAKKLNAAANSSNPLTRRRAILAKTLGKMHHGKGGSLNTAPIANTAGSGGKGGPMNKAPINRLGHGGPRY